MLLADPPDHTRLRRLVSRSFTPRQVERLRPAVHALVDDLLDDLAEKGDVEFMADFALPLPMAVIGELVGVPAADRADLQPAVRAAAKGIEPVLSDEETEAAIASIVHLGEYFGALLDERRRHPRDDLLSSLVQARENDDQLTDEEITSTAILLFAAGFETTTNLLGNGLLALLTPPRPAGGLAGPSRHRRPRRSRSCCASTVRCSSTCAPRSSRRTSSASHWRGVTASWSCRARPTATRPASTVPRSSTSAGTATRR